MPLPSPLACRQKKSEIRMTLRLTGRAQARPNDVQLAHQKGFIRPHSDRKKVITSAERAEKKGLFRALGKVRRLTLQREKVSFLCAAIKKKRSVADRLKKEGSASRVGGGRLSQKGLATGKEKGALFETAESIASTAPLAKKKKKSMLL